MLSVPRVCDSHWALSRRLLGQQDRPVVDSEDAALRRLLIDQFREIGDRSTEGATYINRDGWWGDSEILRYLPRALAAPFQQDPPIVVLGPQSSGFLLGPLVAREFGAGFVGAHKEIKTLADTDAWVVTTTPPDYRDRHLEFGFRRGLISYQAPVLIVDDWAETGSQLLAMHRLVELCEARVVGTVVIADNLSDNRVRRALQLKSLVHARDLWR